jgi:hypothetical protein
MFESSHVIFPPFFVALFRISNVTDFWRFVNGATAGQQKKSPLVILPGSLAGM